MSRGGKGGLGRFGSAVLALLFALTVPLAVGLTVPQDAAGAAPPAGQGAGPLAGSAVELVAGPGPAANGGGNAANDQAREAPARAQAPTSTTPVTGAPPTVDPAYPYAGYLRTTITKITPTVVTAASGRMMTVTGTMTNISKGTLYDLRYVWQRGDALDGVAAIKAEIAKPGRPSAVVGDDWRILAKATDAVIRTDLAPGASATFTAVTPIGAGGLGLARRGVFPLMIKVSGDVGQNGSTLYERVGEIHLLTTVLTSAPVATTTPLDPTGTSTGPTEPSTGRTAVSGSLTTTPTTDIPTQGFPSTSASPTTARTTPAPTAPAAAAGTGTSTPVGVNVLWPIVDRPHLGVGGIFLDDDLAKQIAPGGRLYRVLQALTTVGLDPAATTLVLDPELLTELGVMARGYRVSSTGGRPQAALTPSSVPTTAASATRSSPTTSSQALRPSASGPGTRPTTAATHSPALTSRAAPPAATGTRTAPASTTPTPTPPPTPISASASVLPPNTVAGTGQTLAITFLALLQQAAADRQVLVLPYSNPDAVAMVRAGLDAELTNLVATGRTIANRVLGSKTAALQLITNMAYPPAGAVDDNTLAFFAAHGMSQALLSPGTLAHAGGALGAVQVRTNQTPNPGATINAAVTDSDLLPEVRDFMARGTSAGLAVRSNNLAALLAGGSFTGNGTPLILPQAVDFAPNTAGFKLFGKLLHTLQDGGAVAARPLTAIAATATVPATLTYPDEAASAEIDPGYLDELGRVDAAIDDMRASLVRVRGNDTPIPGDILDPLTSALVPVASVGLRADQHTGRSILATAEQTLASLRAGVAITGTTSYTLAASTSPLVVTVRNDLPYVVKVRVVIRGGQSVGMTATDPGVLAIPAGRSQQFKIATEVVKAGRFQVRAQLLAADGADWNDPVTLTVSSSAYGTLTIILIAVAGGALFLMVVLRIVQRIRHRGDPPENAAGADGEDGPPGPGPDSILAAANAPPPRQRPPGEHPHGPPGEHPHEREGN